VHRDLTPMSIAEFSEAVGSGRMVPGQAATTHAYAKIVLQAFLDGAATPDAARARKLAAKG
jgi:hypothetical protein